MELKIITNGKVFKVQQKCGSSNDVWWVDRMDGSHEPLIFNTEDEAAAYIAKQDVWRCATERVETVKRDAEFERVLEPNRDKYQKGDMVWLYSTWVPVSGLAFGIPVTNDTIAKRICKYEDAEKSDGTRVAGELRQQQGCDEVLMRIFLETRGKNTLSLEAEKMLQKALYPVLANQFCWDLCKGDKKKDVT